MPENGIRDHERKYQRRKKSRRKSDKFKEWFSTLLPVILAIVAGVVVIIEWRSAQTEKIISLSNQIERNRANIKENRKENEECATRIAKIEGTISGICSK